MIPRPFSAKVTTALLSVVILGIVIGLSVLVMRKKTIPVPYAAEQEPIPEVKAIPVPVPKDQLLLKETADWKIVNGTGFTVKAPPRWHIQKVAGHTHPTGLEMTNFYPCYSASPTPIDPKTALQFDADVSE